MFGGVLSSLATSLEGTIVDDEPATIRSKIISDAISKGK